MWVFAARNVCACALVLVLLENCTKYDVNNSDSAYTILNNSTKSGEGITSKFTTDSCMDNDDNGYKNDDDDDDAKERNEDKIIARVPRYCMCVCGVDGSSHGF